MEIRWALKKLYSQSYKLEDHMVQLPWLGLLAFFFSFFFFLFIHGWGHILYVSSHFCFIHLDWCLHTNNNWWLKIGEWMMENSLKIKFNYEIKSLCSLVWPMGVLGILWPKMKMSKTFMIWVQKFVLISFGWVFNIFCTSEENHAWKKIWQTKMCNPNQFPMTN